MNIETTRIGWQEGPSPDLSRVLGRYLDAEAFLDGSLLMPDAWLLQSGGGRRDASSSKARNTADPARAV
jgi:hypothetical protein